jgi:ATP-dependent protease HslVU (ClpYQ) peptidase subunit
MTTIVADARSGLMASDSQWISDDVTGSVRKVWRVRGDLVGFAGDLEAIGATLEWFRSGFVGGPPRDECTALILRRTGIFTWSSQDGEVREDAPFFAIGSGGQAARAAMLAGADCRKAVRIACTIDAGTGGRVRVYTLEP